MTTSENATANENHLSSLKTTTPDTEVCARLNAESQKADTSSPPQDLRFQGDIGNEKENGLYNESVCSETDRSSHSDEGSTAPSVNSSNSIVPNPGTSSKMGSGAGASQQVPADSPPIFDSNDTKIDKSTRRNIEAATKAMLKALSQLETPEEKIAALCSRYADLLTEHKKLQNHLKDNSKSQQQMQKEKDRLQTDFNKTLLAKERLENLCRELQKQNKLVKEESLKRSKDEQTKIREVSDRFQTTISEVQNSMTENSNKNQKLKEENEQLCAKVKSLIEQYEKREEYVEMLTKTKDMEMQLVEAKLKEMTMVLAEEKERNLIKRQKLLSDNVEIRQRCETLVAQLEASKKQDKMYTEKFNEFQTTLTKSNDMFNTFKAEMDKMAKRIKSLEKETNMWKCKFDGANQSLVKIMEESIAKEKELAVLVTKNQKLEKLCRALQEERNSLNDKNRKQEREIKFLRNKTGFYDDFEDNEDATKPQSTNLARSGTAESKKGEMENISTTNAETGVQTETNLQASGEGTSNESETNKSSVLSRKEVGKTAASENS